MLTKLPIYSVVIDNYLWGSSIAMFILIVSTLSKTEIGVGNYKDSYAYFFSWELSTCFILFLLFITTNLYSLNNVFGNTSYLSYLCYKTIGVSNIGNLSVYLYTYYGPTLLLVGIILFQAMVSNITILYPDEN